MNLTDYMRSLIAQNKTTAAVAAAQAFGMSFSDALRLAVSLREEVRTVSR